jgi:hypothetical protein
MAFDLKLTLSVSSSPSQFDKGVSTMGIWAKKLFQRIADREGQDHARIQKEVLDREQILASAPSLWEVLTEGITHEADDLNEMRPGLASIKAQVQGNSSGLSLSITSAAVAKRTLNLAFVSTIPKITYKVFQPQGPTAKALQITEGEFTFCVIRESVWLYGRDGEIAIEDAVSLLLGYLVT